MDTHVRLDSTWFLLRAFIVEWNTYPLCAIMTWRAVVNWRSTNEWLTTTMNAIVPFWTAQTHFITLSATIFQTFLADTEDARIPSLIITISSRITKFAIFYILWTRPAQFSFFITSSVDTRFLNPERLNFLTMWRGVTLLSVTITITTIFRYFTFKAIIARLFTFLVNALHVRLCTHCIVRTMAFVQDASVYSTNAIDRTIVIEFTRIDTDSIHPVLYCAVESLFTF